MVGKKNIQRTMMTDGVRVPPKVVPRDRDSITSVASWTRTHSPSPITKKQLQKRRLAFSKGMVHVWEREFCLQKRQGHSGGGRRILITGKALSEEDVYI